MQPASPFSPLFFEATSQSHIPMMQQPSETDTLDQLQTPEQVLLLDKIDELRSKGLSHHGISLPQLIVCGDQSAGKSSLLEGLTRLRFPTDDNTCTTFATEVVLRRQPDVQISCTITPSKTRSQAECREFAQFERKFSSRDDFLFSVVHNDAKLKMARGLPSKVDDFYDDVLRVKYSGPDIPSLTVVDLPGMIVEKLSGGNGAERVEELVTSYMSNDKSIILAVVQAINDPDNQQVFKFLKTYDPTRSRTLGVITKPDAIHRGSNKEKKLISLVRNEEYRLTHGWHAVRNRDFTTKDETDDERDETERQFFATGSWAALPRGDVGIAALRAKLSHVLLQHIGLELPSIVTAVQGAITVTETSLKALGHARETDKEQRAYLTGHAERFQALTHDALRGIYSNRFFALSYANEQTAVRLRTAIQNLNIAFAFVMYQKGHTWDFSTQRSSEGDSALFASVSNHAVQTYESWFEDPVWISRAEFLEQHVGGYVQQSRPSGLPSIVNPWVIGEVFRDQSRRWHEIAKHHLQQVFQAVQDYVEEALGSLVDPSTCNLLMLKQIQPALDERWSNVEAKLEELLIPYTEQDPITYDPGFIRDLEEMRATRYTAKVGIEANDTKHSFPIASSNSTQRLLTESLDDFTNSEILDLMQTYYKASSAISIFINNVAVLAIENCLIKDLAAIFSPTLTANMDDEQLHAIAAESEEIRCGRLSLQHKLEVLSSGKQILHEHMGECDEQSNTMAWSNLFSQQGYRSLGRRGLFNLRLGLDQRGRTL
ncbi:P-loop containing nucleoside triphosphate hydrolase protein [Ophiobolus disseminans]|uniref:P-loop containing nucleoside triphosphate hydrolase protein n=1 Tax=Ophiobolus disseminans TaxID=1469910 RepID=A0A6A7AEY4_9PLEO|nr:P-loop containing nucleoside triphosphate hydrolase protein [Ophiobolus disseminans]